MEQLHVELTFTEELLGTASGNQELHEQFIASKSSDKAKSAEELAALPAEELVEKSKTVFARDDDGAPVLWDYHIKGFFKDACLALQESDGSCIKKGEDQKKLKLTKYMYKRTIDNCIFVNPRKIVLHMPEGGEIGTCQRPLRAETMRGERVALAHSETVPAGTKCQFEVIVQNAKLVPFVKEALAFGTLKGLGQWRNSGKGRFVHTWVK